MQKRVQKLRLLLLIGCPMALVGMELLGGENGAPPPPPPRPPALGGGLPPPPNLGGGGTGKATVGNARASMLESIRALRKDNDDDAPAPAPRPPAHQPPPAVQRPPAQQPNQGGGAGGNVGGGALRPGTARPISAVATPAHRPPVALTPAAVADWLEYFQRRLAVLQWRYDALQGRRVGPRPTDPRPPAARGGGDGQGGRPAGMSEEQWARAQRVSDSQNARDFGILLPPARPSQQQQQLPPPPVADDGGAQGGGDGTPVAAEADNIAKMTMGALIQYWNGIKADLVGVSDDTLRAIIANKNGSPIHAAVKYELDKRTGGAAGGGAGGGGAAAAPKPVKKAVVQQGPTMMEQLQAKLKEKGGPK